MASSFLFLGTGSSTGVPVIGCKCPVCLSHSEGNQRLRPSGLLSLGGKKILIDIGPDFRQQALTYGIDSLDGLILTHTHYDHIAGIDEMRLFPLRQKAPFPCLLSRESFEDLKQRYIYFFQPVGHVPTLSAQFVFQILEEDTGEATFLNIPFLYCSYLQGGMKVTGYRVGDFAYVTDVSQPDEALFWMLKGVRTLVLDMLQEAPSDLHLSLEQACEVAQASGAKETYLTHMNHRVDYETFQKKLPPQIFLGRDGLELSIGGV